MPEKISIEQLIADAIESRLRDLHVSIPGKVDSYDAASQKVDVTLQFKHQLPDGEDGYTTEEYPKLKAVPVACFRGGGMFIAFPMQAGDRVMVCFTDRAIGAYLASGDVSDPGDLTMHGLSGVYVMPCIAPDDEALESPHASNLRMGKDGTPDLQLEVTATEGHLGVGATKKVARGGDSITTSADLATWAHAVEFAVNAAGAAVAPGSKWDDLVLGGAGRIGTINAASCSSKWKAVD